MKFIFKFHHKCPGKSSRNDFLGWGGEEAYKILLKIIKVAKAVILLNFNFLIDIGIPSKNEP